MSATAISARLNVGLGKPRQRERRPWQHRQLRAFSGRAGAHRNIGPADLGNYNIGLGSLGSYSFSSATPAISTWASPTAAATTSGLPAPAATTSVSNVRPQSNRGSARNSGTANTACSTRPTASVCSARARKHRHWQLGHQSTGIGNPGVSSLSRELGHRQLGPVDRHRQYGRRRRVPNTNWLQRGRHQHRHRQRGHRQHGRYNTSSTNTGSFNDGDFNTGFYNTDYNTGFYNTGDVNTGAFIEGNFRQHGAFWQSDHQGQWGALRNHCSQIPLLNFSLNIPSATSPSISTVPLPSTAGSAITLRAPQGHPLQRPDPSSFEDRRHLTDRYQHRRPRRFILDTHHDLWRRPRSSSRYWTHPAGPVSETRPPAPHRASSAPAPGNSSGFRKRRRQQFRLLEHRFRRHKGNDLQNFGSLQSGWANLDAYRLRLLQHQCGRTSRAG